MQDDMYMSSVGWPKRPPKELGALSAMAHLDFPTFGYRWRYQQWRVWFLSPETLELHFLRSRFDLIWEPTYKCFRFGGRLIEFPTSGYIVRYQMWRLWVPELRIPGSSLWDHVSISSGSRDISISGLPAAIVISDFRLHRVISAMVPLCSQFPKIGG